MSGHSKWSSIKHKKGAADAKRGKLFSKLTRAIIVAAREGGPDPDGNATLATAIQKARDSSMPKDNIERAIARGSGATADGEAYETVTYEGYGDGGVAVFVEALTDNRNRTAAEVRHIFAKNDGNLGTSGAVAWLFERKGVLLVPGGSVDEDELMLVAADGGAEDVEPDGSSYQVIAPPDDLAAVRAALDEARVSPCPSNCGIGQTRSAPRRMKWMLGGHSMRVGHLPRSARGRSTCRMTPQRHARPSLSSASTATFAISSISTSGRSLAAASFSTAASILAIRVMPGHSARCRSRETGGYPSS
jgi:YebC/PmpR family DNA-binding regulatory protein